jgi:hypothetical protein
LAKVISIIISGNNNQMKNDILGNFTQIKIMKTYMMSVTWVWLLRLTSREPNSNENQKGLDFCPLRGVPFRIWRSFHFHDDASDRIETKSFYKSMGSKYHNPKLLSNLLCQVRSFQFWTPDKELRVLGCKCVCPRNKRWFKWDDVPKDEESE